VGVTEPQATFSPCFGGPFLVWHPTKYAELLAERLETHAGQAWMVNTGWTGGPYGTGTRIKLGWTRAILDAIHSGVLASAEATVDAVFGFQVPRSCPGVPWEMLVPRNTWAEPAKYDAAARRLADLFRKNFQKYEAEASDTIKAAGPAP
jgi:phosphoenolpyruvate carboxykinase (ATP)